MPSVGSGGDRDTRKEERQIIGRVVILSSPGFALSAADRRWCRWTVAGHHPSGGFIT
ncbi:hypothetical protein Dimus_006104, partial [Dionaea muscipula]